jgi:hypothetical protein
LFAKLTQRRDRQLPCSDQADAHFNKPVDLESLLSASGQL